MSGILCAPVWRAKRANVTRRQTLISLGAASFFIPQAVFAQAASGCVLTPDSGEGPFYFDPDLLRSDIVDGHRGAPLGLDLEVVSADGCSVLTGARVDIWQADALGLYSGYANQSGVGGGVTTDMRGRTYLRGTQISDADGRVSFATIYPSWYGGRTPHIHFKVFVSEREVIAGQVFFPDEINEEVFTTWDPYREHFRRRRAFNNNDMFLVDGSLQGAMAAVEQTAEGFRASAQLAVAAG
ncbi:MAG TPA: protocatechuate dioxygenase [Gammaproteobacteria bacterium]|nr:protocatechuate dioxygenase [Gammaproteobacteria bacterium]